ncbi:MAG TPA: hypothetical protein PLW15_08595, partial [Rhodoglobus sp.]|nr:hypothetical protein [Rhodoglobus sp.]
MSDSTTPEPTPTPHAAAVGAPPKRSRLPLAALIVGIVAIVFAIIPGLSFVAFLPALTALGLGIAGLISKAPARGMALTGVILGPLALLVGIVVSVSVIVGGVASSVDQVKPQPHVERPDKPATQTPKPEAPAEEG